MNMSALSDRVHSMLCHLRNNLFLGLVHNAAVGRPPNVVEEQLLALGAAAGEQGRAVDGAQRSDALRNKAPAPQFLAPSCQRACIPARKPAVAGPFFCTCDRGCSCPKPGIFPLASKRSARNAVSGYARVTAATGG